MRDELEQKLAEEFSFMRPGKNLQEQQQEHGLVYDLYGAFGCDCGDGWYELLRSLCRELTELYEQAQKPMDIVVDQVKEKWGTLRFYYHFQGEQPGIQGLDFIGGPSLRLTPRGSEWHRRVGEIVWKWEKMSGEVCENCGRPGQITEDRGRVATLCQECYQKAQARSLRIPFPWEKKE